MCFFMYKKYVQPSYGCRGKPVFAGMCVYTAEKIIEYIKCNYKKLLEQERKTFLEMNKK